MAHTVFLNLFKKFILATNTKVYKFHITNWSFGFSLKNQKTWAHVLTWHHQLKLSHVALRWGKCSPVCHNPPIYKFLIYITSAVPVGTFIWDSWHGHCRDRGLLSGDLLEQCFSTFFSLSLQQGAFLEIFFPIATPYEFFLVLKKAKCINFSNCLLDFKMWFNKNIEEHVSRKKNSQ